MEKLEIIKGVINKFIPDGKIILFGSRVDKTFTEDSDFDFCVISPKNFTVQEKRKIQSQIRKELAEYKIPIDIIIQNKNEFEKKKKITGHIIKQIALNGVML